MIDKIMVVAFYLLAAGVTFSTALTEISTISIIILMFIKRILTKDYSLPGGALSYVLLGFVIWNLLSFYNTSYLYESFRGFLKVFKYMLLFMATIDYFNSRLRIKRYLLFLIGVSFIIALDGIVQYLSGADLIRGRIIDHLDFLHRVSASFVHSNDFGVYLVVMLTILSSLFFSSTRKFKGRILLLVAILPVSWCFLKTQSRGAWLSFIVAILCLFSIKSKKIFIIILILLVMSPFFLPDNIKQRFSDFSTIATQGTAWERVKLWQGTARMVKAHPILGFGVNTYTKNFPEYKPENYPDAKYTHNSYLHMAAEIGVVGVGIFIAFLLLLIISAGTAIKKLQRGIYRDLYLGLLAGVIGFLCHCFVDTHLYSVTLAVFLFLCLGMVVAFKRVINEEAA
jgi:putative inorganic carbon (HCO3(-)) transporter